MGIRNLGLVAPVAPVVAQVAPVVAQVARTQVVQTQKLDTVKAQLTEVVQMLSSLQQQLNELCVKTEGNTETLNHIEKVI